MSNSKVLDFIHSRPQDQALILEQLHHLIMLHPKVSAEIQWKIPVYKIYSYICYTNPFKNGSVELVFPKARELSNTQGMLDFKSRKYAGGITFNTTTDINETLVNEIIHEAILLDEILNNAKK